jgi:hypothetical protein
MDDLAKVSWSNRTASIGFRCSAFGSDWDDFVAEWAGKAYTLVGHALGPFGEEPGRDIKLLEDGAYLAGANASYQPGNGQIRLCRAVEGNPGMTLEKLCHEITHANLARFPEGDPFYEESVVDYSVWIMAHAPIWGKYRQAMLASARSNILTRRERAFRLHTDYDCKRWAGGVFAAMAYGPFILTRLRAKKMTDDLTW